MTTLFNQTQFKELISLAKIHSPALFYPIFLLIFDAAADVTELINLKWQDVHFKNKTISLNPSKDLQLRDIIVSEALISALSRLPNTHTNIFTNLQNKPFPQQALGKELKLFIRQTNYNKNLTLKNLHTSYIYNFIQKGSSIQNLQKILGHKNQIQTLAHLKTVTKNQNLHILNAHKAVQEYAISINTNTQNT